MVICPIGGGPAGGGFTVTVVDAVFVPPSPMTVTVYCKVVGGHTCRDPPAATLPIPWSIETADAFVEDQGRSPQRPPAARPPRPLPAPCSRETADAFAEDRVRSAHFPLSIEGKCADLTWSSTNA